MAFARTAFVIALPATHCAFSSRSQGLQGEDEEGAVDVAATTASSRGRRRVSVRQALRAPTRQHCMAFARAAIMRCCRALDQLNSSHRASLWVPRLAQGDGTSGVEWECLGDDAMTFVRLAQVLTAWQPQHADLPSSETQFHGSEGMPSLRRRMAETETVGYMACARPLVFAHQGDVLTGCCCCCFLGGIVTDLAPMLSSSRQQPPRSGFPNR